MTRSPLALAAAGALALAVGCSHDQPPPPRTAAAPPPARVAEAPKPPPAEETPEAPPASKPDNAIYFDFDSALVRDDARPVLQTVAESIKHKARANVRIEGNCDEQGTVEYNMALGDHRARAAKEYLVHMGVPAKKIATVSYGSQRPRDPGHDDAARAKNRRDDIVVQ